MHLCLVMVWVSISIDALELGLALKKRYGIHLNAESAETKEHFKSIQSLVALVEAQKTA